MSRILTFIFILAVSCIFGEIKQVTKWHPVKEAVSKASPDAWVVFDVDEVIITSQDTIFHPANHQTFLEIRNEVLKRISEETAAELTGIILSEYQVNLIDPKIFEVFETVREKKLKAFALTHAATGNAGKAGSLEDWRIKSLKDLGIDFHELSQEDREQRFEARIGHFGTPLLKKGIIFAADQDKGEMLSLTWDALGEIPKQVIFIDDKEENLISVEKVCKEKKIPFTGFHYVKLLYDEAPPVDKEKAKLQFEILEKEKRWINDQELHKWGMHE